MAYISLRSEKSISDLTEKLYKDLTPEKRKAAEAALIKENPKLRDFSRLKPGTLLRIPKIRGLERKKTRSIADPEGDLLDDFIDRLEIFNDKLVADNAKKDKEQKVMQSDLKKAAISRLIASDEQAKQVAASLNQHLATDLKKRKETEKDSKKALGVLKKDLEKRLN